MPLGAWKTAEAAVTMMTIARAAAAAAQLGNILSFFALAKPASSGQFSQFKGRKENT